MTKLYPPVIESTIPACYDENGMVKFTIPFSMNRAVSAAQVGGFELKIKTVQTGAFLYTLRTGNASNYKITDNESYVTFYLEDINNKLKIGQFYKVQLAYLMVDEGLKNKAYFDYLNGISTLQQYEEKIFNNCTVGYYSSVGVLKYTTKPIVYIDRLKEGSLNSHLYTYTGYYSQVDGDISEKVYSYQFTLYTSDGTTIAKTTGEKLHDNSADTNINLSFDIFEINSDLKYYETYYIQYIVTTVNKMIVSSPKYRIIQRETIDPELTASIEANTNFNKGSIDITLVSKPDYYVRRALDLCEQLNDNSWLTDINSEIMIENFSAEQAEILLANSKKLIKIIDFNTLPIDSGSFLISRADENGNYANWEPIYKFNLIQQTPQGLIYSDCTVEQGKKYIYSIQQYNDRGLYSKRIYSNEVTADFEDMFLFDGERQLKIRFNPKVSKYSNTILEAKQDTIGSKYPFIFRNGQVNYHEFTISGLISYLMDDLQTFLYRSIEIPTINYTTENVQQERIFKNQVLEWLNDGKPKLFRTPVEGNFIVRLMKVSLSPEDKLGRLLHTFNCNACEIAEYTNENLQKMGLMKLGNDTINPILRFSTIDLFGASPGAVLNKINNNVISITYLKCEEMVCGDELLITYKDNSQDCIKIGITGNYEIGKTPPITSIIVLPRYRKVPGVIDDDIYKLHSYKYYILNDDGQYEKVDKDAGYDKSVTYYEIANTQLRGLMTIGYEIQNGKSFSIIEDVQYSDPTHRQFIGQHDILKEIQYIGKTKDVKKQLAHLYYLRVFKRPIDKIISQNSGDDNNIYYYGLNEESDKLMFKEIRYPIGLRAYEPNKYYKKVNGVYTLASGEYEYEIKNPNTNQVTGYVTYYLKGKYIKSERIVGKVVYKPGDYYILQDGVYIKSMGAFNDNETYYNRWVDYNNKPHYSKVNDLTVSKDYVFEPGKFYRKTDNGKYTLSNSYVEDEEQRRSYYYRLVDHTSADLQKVNNNHNHDSLYVNAYVTKEQKYVYSRNTYYMQIESQDGTIDNNGNLVIQKKFALCRDVDFNIHNIPDKEKLEDDTEIINEVEYGLFNGDVINYYSIKPILPHILHQIGTKWDASFSYNVTPNQFNDTITDYTFIPMKDNKNNPLYIDFNNNSKIYNQYEPWIKINDEYIYVDDTLIFTINDLQNLNITQLLSGNGVVVEIGYQIQNIDYKIEYDALSGSREDYDKSITILEEKLDILNDPSHEDYINLSEEPAADKQIIYNSYYDHTYQQSAQRNYLSLIQKINKSLNL